MAGQARAQQQGEGGDEDEEEEDVTTLRTIDELNAATAFDGAFTRAPLTASSSNRVHNALVAAGGGAGQMAARRVCATPASMRPSPVRAVDGGLSDEGFEPLPEEGPEEPPPSLQGDEVRGAAATLPSPAARSRNNSSCTGR